MVHAFLTSLPGGAFGAMVVVMAIMFLLGFFLDFIEITFVVVPIVAPILLLMDLNPVWLGIMIALNLQTSFLTPPMAMAAYYLKGVAPPHVQLIEIFRGVMPFLFMVFIAMILLYVFPGIALWLPTVVYGR